MNILIEPKPAPVVTTTQNLRAGAKKPQEVISFRGARNVSKRLYDSVHQQVREALPVLNDFPDATFTAKQLCGVAFWGRSAKRQRLIGKCLANAVDQGLLPLEIINRKRFPLNYRLKLKLVRTMAKH